MAPRSSRKRTAAQAIDPPDAAAAAAAPALAAKRPRKRPCRTKATRLPPTPCPEPTLMATTNSGFSLAAYPHILEAILEAAPFSAVLALAGTCKALRNYLAPAHARAIAVNKPARVGVVGLGDKVILAPVKLKEMDTVQALRSTTSFWPRCLVLDIETSVTRHPYNQAIPALDRLSLSCHVVRYPPVCSASIAAKTYVAVLHDFGGTLHRPVFVPPRDAGLPVVRKWALAMPLNRPSQNVWRLLPVGSLYSSSTYMGTQTLPLLTVIHLLPAIVSGAAPWRCVDGHGAEDLTRTLRDAAKCLRVSDPECRVVLVGLDTPHARDYTGWSPDEFLDNIRLQVAKFAFQYPPAEDGAGTLLEAFDDRTREDLAAQFIAMTTEEYVAAYDVDPFDLRLERGEGWLRD